jgi:hypothetical protein
MSNFNPFEAPTEDSRAFSSPRNETRKVLMKFRRQTAVFGGVWIFFGVLWITWGDGWLFKTDLESPT